MLKDSTVDVRVGVQHIAALSTLRFSDPLPASLGFALQVAARFVEPMQSNLRQLVGHRKYKNLAWEKAKVRMG